MKKIRGSGSADQKEEEKESGGEHTAADKDAGTDKDGADSGGTTTWGGMARHIIMAAAALSAAVTLLLAWLLYRIRKAGIHGTVRGHDGAPLCGVEVTLSDADGKKCRTAVTDENGCFHFSSRKHG